MQRLENLEITKVAFVPEGDNRKADVLLFKSKPTGDPNSPFGVTTDFTGLAPKEAVGMKRVLLAIGKALGFEEDGDDDGKEPAVDPAAGKEQDPPTDEPSGKKDPDKKTKKGVDVDMKIDKSKLTPEELAQLEAIEKKAGIEEDPAPADDGVKKDADGGDEGTKKAAPADDPSPADEGGDDIYKGLHPAVAAELKELRKRADAAEERELMDVAKKYELIGKKPEELVKTLKVLKSAGGTAYDEMISVLDASLQLAEKSGAFSEVGKSGSGQPDAWEQIEKHAAEIMKAAPTLSRAEAIEKACEQHPDLVAEYENNR